MRFKGIGRNIETGLGPLAPAVALVSPAFWIAWVELVYSGEMHLGSYEPTSTEIIFAYVVSTTAMALMLIAFGFLHHQVARLLQHRSALLAFGALAGLATLGSSATGSVLATLLTGVFTAFLIARFGTLLAQVNPKAAMLAIIFSQILASFVYGYVLMLPGPWGVVVLCLLPLLAAAGSLLDGGKLRYEVAAQADGAPAPFVRLVCAVALFSLAINIVRGFYPSLIEMDTFAEARGNSSVLFFFVKMGLACTVLALPTRTNLPKLCYYGFVVLAFLTLPLPAFGLGSDVILEMFGCVNALLNIVIWTLLVGIAYKSGRSVVRLVGWGYGGMALGSAVGWLVGFGLFAGGVEAPTMTAIEILMLGVMLLSCMFVVTGQVVDRLFDPADGDVTPDVDRSLGDERGAEQGLAAGLSADASDDVGDGGPAVPGVSAGRWEKAALAMGYDHELSARESDVLALLLRGYSKQRIAEELFISYNTVRSHVRSIYAKCDAHNQQDLILQFEEGYLAS